MVVQGQRARQPAADLGRQQEAGRVVIGGRARQQKAMQDQPLAEALRRDILGDLRPGADGAILGGELLQAHAAAQGAQVLECSLLVFFHGEVGDAHGGGVAEGQAQAFQSDSRRRAARQ